jgi:uncharacterized MAPEG superfamily protein
MTTDLWMLLASTGLTWALIMLVAVVKLMRNGLSWGFGNHETIPELSGWLARAKRASDNMSENLPLFAVAVIIVHLAGKADATSALGAQIFLGGRIAHAAVYIAGIPVVRTLAWTVAIAGLAMVVSVLF